MFSYGTTHYGLRFGGVDANSNAYTFQVLVPLSHEYYAVEKPDHFRAAGEGSDLIELRAAEDPVSLEEIELFGGLGRSSTLTAGGIAGYGPCANLRLCAGEGNRCGARTWRRTQA